MTTPIANARSQARKLDGARKQALEPGRNRLLVTAVVLNLAFAAVIARVVDLTVMTYGSEPRVARTVKLADPPTERADVVDRIGVILATSLPTVSLYADPGNILNVDDAGFFVHFHFSHMSRERVRRRSPNRSAPIVPTEFGSVIRTDTPEGTEFALGQLYLFSQRNRTARVFFVQRIAASESDLFGRQLPKLPHRFLNQLSQFASRINAGVANHKGDP